MKSITTPAPRQAQTFTQDEIREIIATASAAAPVGEIGMQMMGDRRAWATTARPGAIEARRKFMLATVSAARIAMQERPQLELRHILAAIRSHALRPGDLLIDSISGKWLSSKQAVTHRGTEYGRSIAEIAMGIMQAEEEAAEQQ